MILIVAGNPDLAGVWARHLERQNREIAFGRKTRFAKMHLVVDHTRHQVFASRIDNLATLRRRDITVNALNTFAVDEHVNLANFTLVDQTRIRN